MPLPFHLVEKLYAAGFPYAWITWEGKLWEDPENQPNLGQLIAACGPSFLSLCSPESMKDVRELEGDSSADWYANALGKAALGPSAIEAVTNLWLVLPRPAPRPPHVDMPTSL